MSSAHLQSQLIHNLDTSLREVLQHPTQENIHACFTHLQQCHRRRLDEEKVIQDDQLYIPAILLLRQFPRFQDPAVFDALLGEFIPLFQLMPISTKKTLDDLLCVISIILTKRIMTSNDEVQQNLFVRFFRAFILAIKGNVRFFCQDFLGDFNRNLPILGHYLSCLLQLFERVTSLDFRLDIIDTLWSLIYVDKHEHQNEFRSIVGQMLACFLPGMLKTFVQDLGSVHQRLVQANLLLLSYLIRLCAHPSSRYEHPMKEELRDLVIERNDQWLLIVDGHIAPLLQRLTKDYVHHDSSAVRRALAMLMITILCFSSTWLKLSGQIALKTMLVIVSVKTEEPNETIVKVVLEKLFQLPTESRSMLPAVSSSTSVLLYEDELIAEILHSSDFNVSDHLLRECQTDLFQLFNQQEQLSSSSTYTDRRWRLQLFIGYYTFIHRHVDFLFNLETFTEKLLTFLFKALDFQTLMRSHLVLLNARSPTSLDDHIFDPIEYASIYKHFQPDVHEDIQQLIDLFLRSHEQFPEYLFEQINRATITEERNLKIFYLLTIIYAQRPFDRAEDYQSLLALLSQLMCDDDKRKQLQKKRKNRLKKGNEPVSLRNATIYFLLQCLRTLTRIDHTEYLIDYIPLLLLGHSSHYTILHQTSLHCLHTLCKDRVDFLVSQSEYIIDISLRKLQTSSYDGYLILVEFVRLGGTAVINQPIMTHVIGQLLLELSCLPAMECIQLTFEFLTVFCEQVNDTVDDQRSQPKKQSNTSATLAEFALEIQNQFRPPIASTEEAEEDGEKKKVEHPWHQMLVSIVDVFQHFISHSNVLIRSYVLDAFPSLAKVLSTIDENLFLPLVHKLWPGLLHRLHDQDINIRIRCLTTIQCLCGLCSDFVDRRIRQDILPVLIQQLQRYRSISSTQNLEYRYLKCLLSHIASILNVITVQFDQIEEIVLHLLQYLQVEPVATLAYEQLLILTKKYADQIWLTLILHDENEFRPSDFQKMKVYKPQPRLIIDSKWKSNLIICFTHC